jgi:photosystem II stability/assembly factor-like uncharacterized protein
MGPAVDHLHAIINRTTDGGKTWQQAAVPGDYGNHVLALRFVDETHGFLMCSPGRWSSGVSTILRSDDGGAAWSVVKSIQGDDTTSLGSQFTASDASTLWAGAQGEASALGHSLLEVSRNGGKTWSPVTLSGLEHRNGPVMLREPPHFIDASTGFVTVYTSDAAGSKTVTYRTTDRGRTWHQVATNTSGSGDVVFVVVNAQQWFQLHRRESGRIMLEGTSDAGRTWSRIDFKGLPADAPIAQLVFNGLPSGAAFLANGFPANDGTLFLTSDEGRNWRTVKFPPAGNP